MVDEHNRIIIMHNNGSGQFTPAISLSLDSARNTLDILAEDLNSDGQDEIVIIQDNGNLTVWSPSVSIQAFTNVSRYLGAVPDAWLIVADVNNDSIHDVGFASDLGPSSGVLVFLAGDSINVENPIIERYYDYSWLGASAVDLDGDMDRDIILCTQQGVVLAIENYRTGDIGSEVKYSGFILPHSPAVINLTKHPAPAIILLCQNGEWYDLNLIDIVVIWRDGSQILD